ncbi:MAG: glycosyltransferase family 4 protein [bacterium]
MKLAYIVGSFPSPSETFIAREVSALRDRGVDVGVFPLWPAGDGGEPRPAPSRRSVGGQAAGMLDAAACLLRCLPGAGLRPMAQALRRVPRAVAIAAQVTAYGFERVHAQFGNVPSTVGWLAARRSGRPFSFAVHARDVFVEAQFLRRKARAADRIIACNTAAADRTAQLVDPSDREKIRLVPHGLPLDDWAFEERPNESRRPLVLGVGRLVEKKGFVHLVRAMARVRHAACWLVGDGPRRAELAGEIATLGLQDRVKLRGWLAPAAVREAYRRASLLGAPSVVATDGDMDGLPNVLLEAAAVGLPIVGTRVGGLGDLLVDGHTALVAEPGQPDDLAEKVQAALDDLAASRRRAQRARAEVEARFDQKRTISQLLDALPS